MEVPMKSLPLFVVGLLTLFPVTPWRALATEPAAEDDDAIEELNPQDPNVEEYLNKLDKIYEETTGEPSHLKDDDVARSGCSRQSCHVWAVVDKSSQTLSLYIDGSFRTSWLVSTGRSGYTTPDFDTHPNGRI